MTALAPHARPLRTWGLAFPRAVSASVWGEPGVYGVGGQESVVHDDSGVEFTFRHSNGSNNGTEVASGNLPALYFHC